MHPLGVQQVLDAVNVRLGLHRRCARGGVEDDGRGHSRARGIAVGRATVGRWAAEVGKPVGPTIAMHGLSEAGIKAGGAKQPGAALQAQVGRVRRIRRRPARPDRLQRPPGSRPALSSPVPPQARIIRVEQKPWMASQPRCLTLCTSGTAAAAAAATHCGQPSPYHPCLPCSSPGRISHTPQQQLVRAWRSGPAGKASCAHSARCGWGAVQGLLVGLKSGSGPLLPADGQTAQLHIARPSY